MALTLDVLQPAQPNGAGVIWVVSGGFRSSHAEVEGPGFVQRMGPFMSRGYTVFAVVHGSMPKFEMRECCSDLHRAVRYIRLHAKDFGVDAERLGISGGSAGGFLSLWIGCTGSPGNPKSPDPVERESSRVRAVACFYPPTDWENWDQPGSNALPTFVRLGIMDGMRFREYDPAKQEHVLITDEAKVTAILREYSVIHRVSPQSAATLIIHGDKDDIVPLSQATNMIEKLKAANVPAELVVRPGLGHGWANMGPDVEKFADWYDKQLAK